MILIVSDLRREIEESLNVIEELIAERVEEGLTDAQRIERNRTLFLVCIISGFSVNMLLCAYLLIRYSRDFARRFHIVIDNTSRVAQGLPLNELVDGSDELRDLDVVFHDMDLALKEAQAKKEQLMSMVSHDLRGPLTSALISLELLLCNEAFQLTDKTRKRISDTDKMVKRLSRLVNDVLDFDKLKIGKLDLTLDMVPLKPVLDDCVTELQPILEREEILIVCEDVDVDVVADRERLPQVLLNLMSNAIKFSPKGSQILISTTAEKMRDESDKTDFVKIEIQDQGPGVPELYRETIFLPFEQVPDDKRPKKGTTGLGLPICKMLVDLHGGTIGVDVPEDGGSIFWFTLPAAEIDEL
ncbi:MAG: HAMP domain-containing sensor histidine kinase [Candidatus Melainabacteria bacterium]|nr:HAMP domain-containing sensor histidine kinase [Candidatus Melainabacteria bacterium]